MKAFVAGHEVVSARDFAELSLGLDVELFAGLPVSPARKGASDWPLLGRLSQSF